MLRISVSSGVITRPAKNDGYVDSVSLHGSDYESMKDLEPRIRIIPVLSVTDWIPMDLTWILNFPLRRRERTVYPLVSASLPNVFPGRGEALESLS